MDHSTNLYSWNTGRPSTCCHVGNVIRKLRNERAWTLEELAANAGVNKATISQLERGQANPRGDTLDKLAQAFGKVPADLYAATTSLSASAPDVEDEMLDMTGVSRSDIPIVAEGEANPRRSLFRDHTGPLMSDVGNRVSRPYDLRDPRAYGVRVRGDSMMPAYRPGMVLVVSPNTPVASGDEVYLQLRSGEWLLKVARSVPRGWLLESINPAYEPRFVKKREIRAMHPVVWARRKR
jgi:phage repressor protein C with HTH and peptisase S24 domain